MRYLMLVCWDAERMNARPEPDPSETAEDDGFPWLDELRERNAWVIGDQLASPRDRHGRTLRRDEGGHRRVRPHRGRQLRGGGRDRLSPPRRRVRHDRGAAALGLLTAPTRSIL